MAFFSRGTYCIITGASTGLGRELAIQLARRWSKYKSVCKIILIARDLVKLQDTKERILSEAVCVGVAIVQADLSDLSTLNYVCEKVTAGYERDQYQQAAIFHNAGSLGDIVNPTASQVDSAEINKYLTLNYTSMWMLTASFLSDIKCDSRLVFNMSSHLAKCPLGGLAAYSSIKAARNVFVQSIALEYPNVRFLNYSPGPCDTRMFHTLSANITLDTTRSVFDDIKLQSKVLTTDQSISKLIKIIENDVFENGCVIDYYDD